MAAKLARTLIRQSRTGFRGLTDRRAVERPGPRRVQWRRFGDSNDASRNYTDARTEKRGRNGRADMTARCAGIVEQAFGFVGRALFVAAIIFHRLHAIGVGIRGRLHGRGFFHSRLHRERRRVTGDRDRQREDECQKTAGHIFQYRRSAAPCHGSEPSAWAKGGLSRPCDQRGDPKKGPPR